MKKSENKEEIKQEDEKPIEKEKESVIIEEKNDENNNENIEDKGENKEETEKAKENENEENDKKNEEIKIEKENEENKKEEENIEKKEEVKEEIKEEPKKDNNIDDDDLDVISDKQPEIADVINPEKKEEVIEPKEEKEEMKEEKKEENDLNNNIKEDIKENNEIENNKENNENKEKESEIISEKNEEIKVEEEKNNEIPKEPEEKIPNYKIDYYRENLFNLLDQLSNDIPLSEVPDFLKRAFAMDESLFSEKFYFKGIFPKIIISRSTKDDNKIKGMCSFYYENSEDLNENLTLRINTILVSQDYEEQITEMINFIKEKVDNDKIVVYILYDKCENKFICNSEAKNLFIDKLMFKWLCVVRDEKLNQRYIKYFSTKKEENYDVNDIYHETTKMANAIRYNRNNFLMNNVLIASINKEEEASLIREQFKNKISYTKYMNINSLYFLLLQSKNIKLDFPEQKKKDELQLMSEKIMKYSIYENNYGNEKPLTKNVKKIENQINGSIYKEIKDFLAEKNINCLPDSSITNLFINFETNYSAFIGDIYYNRISSDKIQILEEEKTGTSFYLIPSKDNNTLFYISQMNNKLREYLLDDTKNVYEKFLQFQPSTQKQISEYSKKSYRDVSYIPISSKDSFKTIYIPCFAFKTHLFAYDFKDIDKSMKLDEIDNNKETHLNITSVDEFINVEFKPDCNINDSFSTIEPHDLIIDNSFIMGIFDNDIINNEKLPLLQFLYVTKEYFLTKSNYKFS